MIEKTSTKDLHAVLLRCPCCGRRARASEILRAWLASPKPTFLDAEAMLTRSTGPRTLRNPLDAVMLAVYHGDVAEVVVEDSRMLSLEDQAWVSEGKQRFSRMRADVTAELPEPAAVEEPAVA